MFISILLQTMTLVMFLMRAREGSYPSLDADGLFATSLAASPFILSALVGSIFISLLYLAAALAAAGSGAYVTKRGRAGPHHL